jgi:thioredoxin-like negative regulator of GroEL
MNLLCAALVLASSSWAAPVWLESHSQAQAAAQGSGQPLLIEFQAPWCYSCYYMAANVLSKDAFAAAARGLVLLKEDVDKEEGGELKARYSVTALPSFVLVDPKGEVLGRIAGEQTEADFLARLKGFLKGAAADPLDEAAARLEQRLAAGQTQEAARDISRLPAPRLKSLRGRQDWRVLEARLGLSQGQGRQAAAELKTLLDLDDSCALAYDVMDGEKAVASLPAPQRKSLLEAEQAALEKLSEKRLLVPRPQRCADFRSGVEALADVYDKLGLKPRRAELVRRASAQLEGMGLKTGEDRNHDDDRRFFLELAGDGAAVRAFYGELVAAYPSDYVYAYRYARYLLDKKDAAGALRSAESADRLAYGANRLSVTKVRSAALIALGRQEEAVALLKRDIKAGQAFPQGVRALQELLDTLGAKAP